MGVAPTSSAAVSTTWNSGRFRVISTMRSPRPIPRPARPAATRQARAAYSCHVHSPQPSPAFQRRATASGREATTAANSFGTVRPATRADSSALLVTAIRPLSARRAGCRTCCSARLPGPAPGDRVVSRPVLHRRPGEKVPAGVENLWTVVENVADRVPRRSLGRPAGWVSAGFLYSDPSSGRVASMPGSPLDAGALVTDPGVVAALP